MGGVVAIQSYPRKYNGECVCIYIACGYFLCTLSVNPTT